MSGKSVNRYEYINQVDCIDERIKQIAHFNFPFITETFCDGQIEHLKEAVTKLKSDCELYLKFLESSYSDS